MIRILIIDDSPEDRELYRRLLRKDKERQYVFSESGLGREGLARYRSEHPAAVLLDYRLPDLDGTMFLNELLAVDKIISTPVIMLTGQGSETVVAEALRAGAADYLSKDKLSCESLSRSINNAIEKFRLQAEIRQRNYELEQKNQELLYKNEEVRRFYHTLSHELKTPLTSAREFAAILIEGLAGPLNETQSEYLNIIKYSCDQMTIEINDLLDATRLDTGKLTLDLQSVCINTVLKQASSSLIPRAQDKKIHLTHITNPGISPALIDHRRITQVVTNLITNALKFTPAGGRVHVEASENSTPSDYLTVSVTDTGRGIELQKTSRIFDRLYQTHGDDRINESGLGLGLYICKELIYLHGGNIWVESIPEKGSTFSFTVRKAAPLTAQLVN